MRLAALEVRDFRSVFEGDQAKSLVLELGEGMNALVGRNNCGKSNVLRAISLALDPTTGYHPHVDNPGPRPFANPEITLTFQLDASDPEEQALLNTAVSYERTVAPDAHPYADAGELRLRVSCSPAPGGRIDRREHLLNRAGRLPVPGTFEAQMLEDTIARLRAAVRFVLVKSGESLESVLEGNFREILHTVIRERLAVDFGEAERSRLTYISGLQDSLLAPLRARLVADVKELFPEIAAVRLTPDVAAIDATLSRVGISLADLVDTPLTGKGTGVRGAVLVAMLAYLAGNSPRSVVFAVEEPEAFLHPAAQEDLRDHLDGLAGAPDVTLLVTTHSPFIVTRSPHGRVFALAKDSDGRTRLSEWAKGDEPHASLVGNLFRDRTFEELLAQSTQLPAGTEAVLLVEGDGDRFCLELAATVVGRPDLLHGIDIRPCGGASKVVVQALVTRAAISKPTLVLVDNDIPGRKAKDDLAKDFGFQNNRQVLSYASVFPAPDRGFPYEAEDLFDPEVIEAFVERHGAAAIDGSARRPDGAFHYDFSQAVKEELAAHLQQSVRPHHVRRWLELIVALRGCAGLPDVDFDLDAACSAGAVASAPDPPAGQAVLVIDGRLDYARYQQYGAVVLDRHRVLDDDVTHVAFYTDAAIQPEVARILADHRSLLVTEDTACQLDESGTLGRRTASIVREALLRDDTMVDTTVRLLVLSRVDEPETLVLPHTVRNDRSSRGRPLAWTVGPRVSSYAALATAPATTTELEARGG